MTVDQLIAELQKWSSPTFEAVINMSGRLYSIGEVGGIGGSRVDGADSVVAIRPTVDDGERKKRKR